MYRIPKDLNLSSIVGQSTSQFRVGQYDIQFTLGGVNFTVESSIKLYRGDALVGHWKAAKWPSEEFYDILNVDVIHWEVVDDKTIAIEFANGMSMHLEDDSDHYESMQIYFGDDPASRVII